MRLSDSFSNLSLYREGNDDRLISKRKCIAVSTLLTRWPPFPVALIPVSSISQSAIMTALDISSMVPLENIILVGSIKFIHILLPLPIEYIVLNLICPINSI